MSAVYDPLLDGIQPNTVTIIGEHHKKPESIEPFQQIVVEVISKYPCVTIGMEIASGQQPIIEGVIQGVASVDQIELWSAIDHLPYRLMIAYFARFKLQDCCINLIAHDSSLGKSVNRDQWMAMNIAEGMSQPPVLVLLGALHTLKKIIRNLKQSKAHPPFVAELLLS